MRLHKQKYAWLLPCLLCALLCGCGPRQAAVSAVPSPTPVPRVYTAPALHTSEFHQDAAQELPGGFIDLSALSSGYVGVKVENEKRLKFQITLDGQTYTYDLPGDGSYTVFPLNMGDGEYELRLMENISENKYAQVWTQQCTVALSDEFEPFVRPSQMVWYTADSQCVAMAKELADGCESDLEVAGAVYEYLVQAIDYDYDKAQSVKSGYLPSPDDTLATGMGICFDYASLAAAMLRSQGIPCQVITGYVSPDEIYHAWNRIYLQDQGWISVEIKASQNSWNRVDITFAATGVPTSELSDDALYTTRLVY